jgi:mRNA interferase RelE/StbE
LELHFTAQFEEAYEKLTPADKRAVSKSLLLRGENLAHPGLRVKKMEGKSDIFECLSSLKLRLTFRIDKDAIILRSVGDHDKVLKNP